MPRCERNVITYTFRWRDHPVLGWDGCLAEKSNICRHSKIKPMQKEGQLLQRALTIVISDAYVCFMPIL